MRVLIKGAMIVDPRSTHSGEIQDIFIEEGVIRKIGSNIDVLCDQLIEFENLHASVGWFDPCVSFGEPGYEERETLNHGLLTAAKSGFTTIILNPNTLPVIDSHSAIGHIMQLAKNAPCELHVCGSLTNRMQGTELSPLFDMHRARAIAFGDYKKDIGDPYLLKIALQYVQSFSGTVISFPQIGSLHMNAALGESDFSLHYGINGSPEIAETVAVLRDLEVLYYTKGKLHFQLISCQRSVELIEQAKSMGAAISSSVGLPHLIFSTDDLSDFDANLKQSPPLRTREDINALAKGLKNGTIDMISCMHEPINPELKEHDFMELKEGSIGLEAAFGLLNLKFGLHQTIDYLTRGRIHFGLKPPKIEAHQKANITIFNPDIIYTFTNEQIHSTSKNCAYINQKIKGKVYGTMLDDHLTLN